MLQDWLGDDKAKRHRREIHFPSGRFGEAIEQAQAVLFLATDESSFINGQDFVVDGGMTKVRKVHPGLSGKSGRTDGSIPQAYVTPEGPATRPPHNLSMEFKW